MTGAEPGHGQLGEDLIRLRFQHSVEVNAWPVPFGDQTTRVERLVIGGWLLSKTDELVDKLAEALASESPASIAPGSTVRQRLATAAADPRRVPRQAHLSSTGQRWSRQRTVKNVNGTVKVRLGS